MISVAKYMPIYNSLDPFLKYGHELFPTLDRNDCENLVITLREKSNEGRLYRIGKTLKENFNPYTKQGIGNIIALAGTALMIGAAATNGLGYATKSLSQGTEIRFEPLTYPISHLSTHILLTIGNAWRGAWPTIARYLTSEGAISKIVQTTNPALSKAANLIANSPYYAAIYYGIKKGVEEVLKRVGYE